MVNQMGCYVIEEERKTGKSPSFYFSFVMTATEILFSVIAVWRKV
jgi:hypothetical protein